jgi:hypothetical protein
MNAAKGRIFRIYPKTSAKTRITSSAKEPCLQASYPIRIKKDAIARLEGYINLLHRKPKKQKVPEPEFEAFEFIPAASCATLESEGDE